MAGCFVIIVVMMLWASSAHPMLFFFGILSGLLFGFVGEFVNESLGCFLGLGMIGFFVASFVPF